MGGKESDDGGSGGSPIKRKGWPKTKKRVTGRLSELPELERIVDILSFFIKKSVSMYICRDLSVESLLSLKHYGNNPYL